MVTATPSKSTALPVGARLDAYEIEGVLGTGGFGITYKARDTYLGMSVAIKEYYPSDIVGRPDGTTVTVSQSDYMGLFNWGLDRFIGEGQILARFKHTNIVRVSRYLKANNTGYIVMDFEEGEPLSRFLIRHDEAPDERALLGIFIPVMQGLSEVHKHKVLHLDITPGNIYLRKNGSPVLLDFGAARLDVGQAELWAVQMGSGRTELDDAVLLTPGYAPPEQTQGTAHCTPASDIYGLGASLYRCMAGHAPLPASRRVIEMAAGRTDPFVPVTSAARRLYSPALLMAVDKMLRLGMDERPSSIDAVLDEMQVPRGSDGSQSLARLSGRTRAEQHKLIIAGPVGAGKTTAVVTLSDIDTVQTEATATDMTRERKPSTTVAMDFGVMELGGRERLHIYGTPGQERFDFMWDILSRGAIGLILLVDNSRKDPFKDLDVFIDAYSSLIARAKVAIGVSHTDTAPRPTVAEYQRHLATRYCETPLRAPVFAVDPRSRRDLVMLVRALLYSIDPGVQHGV
jgi:signal recognition particle receptor subunit beta